MKPPDILTSVPSGCPMKVASRDHWPAPKPMCCGCVHLVWQDREQAYLCKCNECGTHLGWANTLNGWTPEARARLGEMACGIERKDEDEANAQRDLAWEGGVTDVGVSQRAYTADEMRVMHEETKTDEQA